MNWGPFYEKIEKSLTMPKKLRGALWDFSTSILSENIKKMKGGPSVIFFSKKSLRAENTLREYPLAPLSFLDDVCGDVIVTCCYSVNNYRSLPKKLLQFHWLRRFGYITPKNGNFQYALPMTGERTQVNTYIIDLYFNWYQLLF